MEERRVRGGEHTHAAVIFIFFIIIFIISIFISISIILSSSMSDSEMSEFASLVERLDRGEVSVSVSVSAVMIQLIDH